MILMEKSNKFDYFNSVHTIKIIKSELWLYTGGVGLPCAFITPRTGLDPATALGREGSVCVSPALHGNPALHV